MIGYANSILQRLRTIGQRFFLLFGLHCATHQIRIILVSCVVITSLFYPALSIYSSSQPKSFSIIDTFISPSTASGFDAQKDLANLWDSHNALRLHEDPITRAKCGVGRALRVERILVQSPLLDDSGVLNHQILLSTLDFESRLEKLISTGDAPCLKLPDGRCLVLSPLLFWDHDRDALLSDTKILLNPSKNVSVEGIVVTPKMVMAGLESNDPHVAGSHFNYAMFLALTYFFPESECLGDTEHVAWLKTVHQALASNSELTVQVEEPNLVALEYDSKPVKTDGWSALSAFLYFAYIGFFAYVAWSVRKMTAVHSRLGVTFTALVEIAVSTITSLSVCALVGFKVTMVPWELLPIVIVFVGAENMFNLVDAVGKTSVTLSVKQRIAEGLSRAGTSNTLKVVSYNCILGVITVFSVGAVRQFCTFAIVVLVAHWFLAHTFFMAVLSIDIQRLELDELLRHDSPGLVPAIKNKSESKYKQTQSGWEKVVSSVKNYLSGRAATNISLLMLLAITATLYYTTYSASNREQASTVLDIGGISHLRGHSKDPGIKPPEWHIWKILNPSSMPLFHLRVELPAIVTFRPDFDSSDQTKRLLRPRFSMRTFRFILWLLKIMVLPIAATTSALWILLLYLLKNAELLEAQRNRGEPGEYGSMGDRKPLEDHVSFSTLPRAFGSDVELISASKDGKVVVSVGLHNEITIWWAEKDIRVSIDTADVLLRTASTSSVISTITKVAIDVQGMYCAVGTGAGAIAAWAIELGQAKLVQHLSVTNLSAGVTDLQFCTSTSETHDGNFVFSDSIPHHQSTPPPLLATYENGVALKWSLENATIPSYFTPSRRVSVIKSSLLRVYPLDRFLVALSMEDGTLELIETQDTPQPIQQEYRIQAGNPMDGVVYAHACEAKLGGSTRVIIAVATENGMVSIWDGMTGECISIFDESYGRINNLRVTPVHCETCRFCGQLPLESLSVAFSVDHVVRFFKLYLNDQTRRCSCSRHQLRHVSSRDSLGLRSRSNSINSQVGSVSPSIPRARLATTFEESAFPVSAHGVHSRRASEKDTGRRSLDTLTVPFSGDEYDSSQDPSGCRTPTNSSFWRDAILVRETDITCERGAWGVNGTNLIGVRRKPRGQGHSQGGSQTPLAAMPPHGLTSATLERWEMWMFDPSNSRMECSLLASLATKTSGLPRPSSSSSPSAEGADPFPRLPFTRVSPLLIIPTHALAGFGNTIGVFKFSNS